MFDKHDAAYVEKLVADSSSAGDDLAEVQGIVESRKKNSKFPDIRYLQPDDLRFGTHKDVAAWRAKRLACDTIIEAGAGVGMQTIAFAKTCKKVIAIEKDHRKMAYCRENCKAAGVTNVELIEGDAMQVVGSLPKVDIVFLDPERPAQEEARNLGQNFSPPLHDFIKAYGEISQSLAIELPPHTKTIDIDGEREYLSVDGELRRLTLYRGPLAKSKTSAVVLPEAKSISGEPSPVPEPGEFQRFLLEVDESVVTAGLVATLIAGKAHVVSTTKGVLCTSDRPIDSPFYRNKFQIVGICPAQIEPIQELLKKAKAKQVILRASIEPAKYWEERRKYEKGLTGTEPVHLFLLGDKAVVANKLKR